MSSKFNLAASFPAQEMIDALKGAIAQDEALERAESALANVNRLKAWRDTMPEGSQQRIIVDWQINKIINEHAQD